MDDRDGYPFKPVVAFIGHPGVDRLANHYIVDSWGSGEPFHRCDAALRLVAARAGLTQAVPGTLYRDDVTPGHDRRRVLTDAAVMMADGGNTIGGIDVLRHHHDLLGVIASAPTLSAVTQLRARYRRNLLITALLWIPVGTLRKWRGEGVGPSGFHAGKHVRFRRSSVERFISEQEEKDKDY